MVVQGSPKPLAWVRFLPPVPFEGSKMKKLVDFLYKMWYDHINGEQSKHRMFTTKYEDLCM